MLQRRTTLLLPLKMSALLHAMSAPAPPPPLPCKQADYQRAWRHSVEAFRALADGCPTGVRVSLEFKPTDPATRFSFVPSTGAALLLARDVDRPNFGLTLGALGWAV